MTDLNAGVLGHWPLATDAADHSSHHHTTRATDVTLGAAGPRGKPNTAATFNGSSSLLEVADHPALRLGAGDFTLAAWVQSDATDGDIVGSIMHKFDQGTRKGVNLCILTSDGVTASAQANYRHLQFGIDDGRIESVWRDHGRPGNAAKISALTVIDGVLYAGTFEKEADQFGRLWRFDGGQNWIDLGNPIKSNCVTSIAEHDGQMYVGTGRYKSMGSVLGDTLNRTPGGKVFRVESDGRWIDCGHPGLEGSVPEPMADGYNTGQADMASGFTSFRGRLYCTQLYRQGVFRYEGGTKWSPVGLANQRMMTLTVFRGALYSLLNGGPVYRYEGGDEWVNCGTPPGSTQTYCAVIHEGKLHVGTWPRGEVCRYEGGEKWTTIGRVGYEMEVMGGANYNGKAYWGSLPMANVYRMEGGGAALSLVGNLDQSVTPIRRVWSMATYEGRLFAGTLPGGRVCSIEAGKVATWDHRFPSGWHHVAAVRQGGYLSSYVDGQLVARSTRFHGPDLDVTNQQPLRIGAGAFEHFRGAMSDVRVYGKALGPSEVASLHSTNVAT